MRPTPRVCAEEGCTRITLAPRCAEHTQAAARARSRRRGFNAHTAGYGKRWQATRKRFLRAYPACERCGDEAVDAHHRDWKGPNGPLGHDWRNLEALCHPCHSRVTGEGPPLQG